MARPAIDPLKRLLDRAICGGPDDCWLHNRSEVKDGYGKFEIAGINYRAHVASWFLHFGPVPAGLKVCHKCDNTRCINPNHLFVATQAENMADKCRKGRQARGETQHLSKLTAELVRYIRASIPGRTLASLADELGVSKPTIARVRDYKTWMHVDAIAN